ncbi:enoyl-CoA hydratase/isomerase family protein [Paracraurococcus lichenis]|uniref:Enoyl-CoA hydratase/isomerase family protein n=1 Tax=Paracraurococcus lichenis TaxID=3064888 RepID=A0ABT9ECU3_9PROT|nr:enoyl-CoA hydratase/isomerase family protein [Paracraurococcus sp. LOR1-02]MDO9713798.1 enoyl-CoA hydratase/isomerase family protein [Paracraurococcus sp. LOR1-02]
MLQDIAQDEAAIRLEVEDGIATLLLNRPAVRNAIDDAMRADLVAVLDRISREDAIRAVVVTGAGKAFCAGGDVRGMKQRLEAPLTQVAINGWRRQQRTHHAIAALHALGKPVIAAVNGAAAGLGCDVALCCDFIIASDQASFAMTYIQRGLIPDGGGMYFLPRRVGLVRAKELIFSGRRVAPEEARSIGMIDRVTTADSLLADARAWARELSQGSLAALALSKSILDQTYELTVEQVFDMGSQAQAICYSTQEHRDSITAFLAKSAAKAGRPS